MHLFEIIKFKFIVILAVLTLGVCDTVFGQNFKIGGWLEDFAQLKQEMSAHYANLEWAVKIRGVNLQELSEKTEKQLRQAQNETEAQQIIRTFLRAFGDGHLGVRWAAKSENSLPPGSAKPVFSPPSLCAGLGYQEYKTEPGVAFSKLESFRELKTEDSKYFSAGVLILPDERKIGIIRIGFFSEHAFPDLCEKAAIGLGLTIDKPCDNCAGPLERETANLLTAALERQVAVLRREKINALLIDITWNDGGTNWVNPAASIFTAKTLHAPRLGFIRHEHYVRQLKSQLEDVETDLRRAREPQRKILSQAAEVLRKALAEARQPCDRSALWQNQKINCSLLVTEPSLYTTGILPFARPGEITEAKYPESRTRLFYPSRYRYQEGFYSGPLLVLVDRETASSAEYFAAVLRDNNAAIIVGESTYGAGCGYTNGGIGTVLSNSRAQILMPDCVRFRKDGTNEVAGITPDILIPWRANDSAYQKASRVFKRLVQVKLARAKERSR